MRGRGIGIVLAGYKHDHAPLNSEDSELIRHLLNQAALAIENAQLVGQLQVRLEEVQQLQRYTEGIFESSPAGIAVLDGERRLVSVNAAFARLAGRDRAELIGRGLGVDAAGAAAARARRGADRGELVRRPGRRAPSPALARRLRPRLAPGALRAGHPRRLRAGGDGERDAREGPPGGPRHAGGRRRPRGQHADHRHLQLRPDAARGHGAVGPALRDPEEGGAADLPRRADRQQPPGVRPQARQRAEAGGAGAAGRREPRPAGRPHRQAAHRGRLDAAFARRRDPGAGLRRRAAAGVHQPDRQRDRRDGRDRRPADRHAWRRAARWSPCGCRTADRASRPRSWR